MEAPFLVMAEVSGRVIDLSSGNQGRIKRLIKVAKRGRKIIVPIILLLFTSCAPLHEQAFAPSTVPTSNFIALETDLQTAHWIVKRTLLKYGFLIESSSEQVVKARKVVSKGKTIDEFTLCMNFDTSLDSSTTVTATAIEKISKGSSRLKVFWLIFIPIPYGTYVTREVVKEETISDPKFYKPLFGQIQTLARENNIEVTS